MYYAIRNTDAKGVYTNEKLFKAKLKTYKGCSFKQFNLEDKESALQWAGVKEIADAQQQVVVSKKQNKKVSQSTKLHPFEQLINKYKQLGYGVLTLEIDDYEDSRYNKDIEITIKDHYYQINTRDRWGSLRSHEGDWRKCFKYLRNRDDPSSRDYYESNQDESYFQERFIETCENLKQYDSVRILKANKYHFFGDFLFLETLGEPEKNSTDELFDYPEEDKAINLNKIKRVSPSGHWTMNDKYLNMTKEILNKIK